MIRAFGRLLAAFAFFALVAPATPNASPPPGLQYDELVRVVIGATPPPPGNFQADVAAINSPVPVAATTAAPRKRGLSGLGSLAGAVLSGQNVGEAAAGMAVSNVIDAQMDRVLSAAAGSYAAAFRGLVNGKVERHAFYNGWERVDDLAAQTATIRKCNLNQVVKLDLAKKTYSIYDPTSEPVDSPAPASPPSKRGRNAETPQPEAPGTAVADFSQTVRPLGPQRIEGLDTAGYDDQTTFAVTQASGSCRNGNFGFASRAYYSKLAQPVSVCPITPARRRYPETPVNMVASGGCRPTFTAHKSGPVPPVGKLALYQAIGFSGGSGATPAPAASGSPAGFTFLTERGNVESLVAGDAAAFEIPKDFTKAP
ncbi:MAG: hypothetical protein NVS2B17_05990 [Candidatus Velthaea sp.]